MNYFDTSVFIAAFQQTHKQHVVALKTLAAVDKQNAGCSSHSLIEIYSVLTRIPPPLRLTAEDGLAVVELVQSKVTTVSLTPTEYLTTIRNASTRGIVGGAIYDAIHIQCAKKLDAARNLHFQCRRFRPHRSDAGVQDQGARVTKL